MLIKE